MNYAIIFTSGFAENQVCFNLLKETVVEPQILYRTPFC